MPVCELTKYAILTSAHGINRNYISSGSSPKPYPPSVLLQGIRRPDKGHSYGTVYGIVQLFQFKPEGHPEDPYIYLGVGRFYIEEWQEPSPMSNWESDTSTAYTNSGGIHDTSGTSACTSMNTSPMMIKVGRRICMETLLGGPVPEEESLYHLPLFRQIWWENRDNLVNHDSTPPDDIIRMAFSVLMATKSPNGEIALPPNVERIRSEADIVLAKDLKNLKPFEVYLADPTGDRLKDVVREL
jgi:hypothetical protein